MSEIWAMVHDMMIDIDEDKRRTRDGHFEGLGSRRRKRVIVQQDHSDIAGHQERLSDISHDFTQVPFFMFGGKEFPPGMGSKTLHLITTRVGVRTGGDETAEPRFLDHHNICRCCLKEGNEQRISTPHVY